MKLIKARVQNYRSIKDSGEFDVEDLKTIFVGPNEAGKTVLLRALQQLHRPADVDGFDAIRDYPRSLYDDITTGKVNPKDVAVVTGYFKLDQEDKDLLPAEYHKCSYELTAYLNKRKVHSLLGAPKWIFYKDVKGDLLRLATHATKQYDAESDEHNPSTTLNALVVGYKDYTSVSDDVATAIQSWLDKTLPLVDEDNEKETARHQKLETLTKQNAQRNDVLDILGKRVPVFVYFNNYFRVRPSVNLDHLATRTEQKILDDKYYDYGNLCLLKLLGFTPRELSNVGKLQSPASNDDTAIKTYRDALDDRTYRLNAASVRLTREIREIWKPSSKRPEADTLRIAADGQYLKVVVVDEEGVEVELDQRSEGFQWIVSFFVVFFAEAMDKHKGAILLLDEPAMSLHALKQREFRETISRLAGNNQTLYTTHSPFLVGSNELDLVRVVELKDRTEGTKVHTTISSSDPAGLLPLQEALGYDLAQSLFAQSRNLVLEGITDYWYIDATAQMLRNDGVCNLNEKIALVFADSAGKLVYYATILHAHKLKVAALLDSDAAGDAAAKQDSLVNALGNKNILRTKDFYEGEVVKSEIEDLLRETLIQIAKKEFGMDVSKVAADRPAQPIVNIFDQQIPDFSKYKLAKAYIRWTRDNDSSALQDHERKAWKRMITKINSCLK